MNINIRSNPMRKWFIWAIVLIGCLPINKALAQQSGDAERNTCLLYTSDAADE